jgi:hypothetical protein
MKRTPAAFFISIAIAACILLTAKILGAQQASSYDTQPEVAEQAVDPYTFRVIILGTRSGPDIELIRKNMDKLKYVTLFVPSSVSQKRIEFEGRSIGDEETLVADIESLSQDRFEVKSKRDRRRGLVITLRKIPPVATSAE